MDSYRELLSKPTLPPKAFSGEVYFLETTEYGDTFALRLEDDTVYTVIVDDQLEQQHVMLRPHLWPHNHLEIFGAARVNLTRLPTTLSLGMKRAPAEEKIALYDHIVVDWFPVFIFGDREVTIPWRIKEIVPS